MVTMASSSTSSCSPPEGRRYKLRTTPARRNPPERQSSKRTTREHSVNSPPSKKTISIDDCLNDLIQIIKNHTQQKVGSSKHDEEIAKVKQILKQDGLPESDPTFAHALVVFKNTVDRRNFLSMETKEGRMNLIEACWEVLRARSK